MMPIIGEQGASSCHVYVDNRKLRYETLSQIIGEGGFQDVTEEYLAAQGARGAQLDHYWESDSWVDYGIYRLNPEARQYYYVPPVPPVQQPWASLFYSTLQRRLQPQAFDREACGKQTIIGSPGTVKSQRWRESDLSVERNVREEAQGPDSSMKMKHELQLSLLVGNSKRKPGASSFQIDSEQQKESPERKKQRSRVDSGCSADSPPTGLSIPVTRSKDSVTTQSQYSSRYHLNSYSSRLPTRSNPSPSEYRPASIREPVYAATSIQKRAYHPPAASRKIIECLEDMYDYVKKLRFYIGKESDEKSPFAQQSGFIKALKQADKFCSCGEGWNVHTSIEVLMCQEIHRQGQKINQYLRGGHCKSWGEEEFMNCKLTRDYGDKVSGFVGDDTRRLTFSVVCNNILRDVVKASKNEEGQCDIYLPKVPRQLAKAITAASRHDGNDNEGVGRFGDYNSEAPTVSLLHNRHSEQSLQISFDESSIENPHDFPQDVSHQLSYPNAGVGNHCYAKKIPSPSGSDNSQQQFFFYPNDISAAPTFSIGDLNEHDSFPSEQPIVPFDGTGTTFDPYLSGVLGSWNGSDNPYSQTPLTWADSRQR